ncbi:hypothetical protein D3C87_1614050 [compost metagenome]
MASTQTTSPSVSADMIQNATRHPTVAPSNVPSGTPRDSAIGVPTIANAIARPCCQGATMRRA